MSVEVTVAGLGLVAIGGLGWYGSTFLRASREIADPLLTISSLDIQQKPQEEDLIDIGTGQQAEEKLGNELGNARNLVLIAGSINTTVLSLIRNYFPPKVVLRVIVNPQLSKAVYLGKIASTYSGDIRGTDKILNEDITVFFIDGKETLILRNKDNGVLIARDENAAVVIAKKSSDMWFDSKPLELR
jgi:hypothetical protein